MKHNYAKCMKGHIIFYNKETHYSKLLSIIICLFFAIHVYVLVLYYNTTQYLEIICLSHRYIESIAKILVLFSIINSKIFSFMNFA